MKDVLSSILVAAMTVGAVIWLVTLQAERYAARIAETMVAP